METILYENENWLDKFNMKNSRDTTFDIYDVLNFDAYGDSNIDEKHKKYEEALKKYCSYFSDIFYIKCYPFLIDQWKDHPEIYDILKRYAHTANGYPLEILIWKYSDEAMQRARKITEENRKRYEDMWFTVRDPNEYQHMIWYFWGTSWRICEEVIKDIKEVAPEKIKVLEVAGNQK